MMARFILILASALIFSGCQPEESKTVREVEEIKDCEDCPEMVLIPKGRFMMGALPYDKDADKYEKPRHLVQIPHDFYMGKFEVTYGQYMACVRDGGCGFTPPNMFEECKKKIFCSGTYRKDPVDANKLPVVGVSYNDAQEYVAWLSGKTGQEYRLPTEEEWEYAARGGTETIFWWGDKVEDGHTICSNCDARNSREDIPLHVGYYPPNPFGLHDMLGNAQEIVGGCTVKFYSWKLQENNIPSEKICSRRSLRGSSWSSSVLRTRASFRVSTPSDKRWDNTGFRIAKSVNTIEKGDEK